MNTEKNIKNLASALVDCLELIQRDTGEGFYCVRDGLKKSTEDKVRDLMFAAHNNGEFTPDDFRYEKTKTALELIASGELTGDSVIELADAQVDIYNSDLLKWASSNLSRSEYVNEAVSEYGWPGGIMPAIIMGQAKEIEEIFGAVLHYLTDWND